jgi:Flp pilus assembly protein TadD
VASLAVLPYLTAFPGDFVSDAQAALLKNRALRESGEWLAWFGRTFYWGSTLDDPTLYRPLTVISFVAQLRSTGLRAWTIVLGNVALHAGVSVLVLRLGRRLLGPVGGLSGALLFAVHPIHVEAVAWVMGRSELLAAGFGLGACLAALRASDPGERRAVAWAAGGAASYLAAALSKEHAVALIAWFPLPWAVHATRARGFRPPRGVIWLIAGSALALGVFLLLRAYALAQVGPGDPVQRAYARPLYNPMVDAPAPARWLTAAAVVSRYARLLVWPARSAHLYSYAEVQVSQGLGAAELAGALLVVGTLLATALALRRTPGLGLALALTPIAFFPVSNFPFAIGTGMAERLLYLPSVGLCLAVGWGLGRLGGPLALLAWAGHLSHGDPLGRRPGLAAAAGPARGPWVGRAVAGVLFVAVAALGGRTLAAAGDWQSAYARMRADVAGAPRSAASLAGLAWEESHRGNQARALELVEASLRIYPNNFAAFGIRGDIFLRRREPARAVADYERGLELAPGYWRFQLYRGRAFAELGRLEEAERDFRYVLRRAPLEYEAHLFLGGLLLQRGRPGEARQHLEIAARLDRTAPTPLVGLALAVLQLGDQRAAARYGADAERRGQPMPESFWSALGGRPGPPVPPGAGSP